MLDRDRIRGADVRDTLLRRPFGLVSVTAIAAGRARASRAGRPSRPCCPRPLLPACFAPSTPTRPTPRRRSTAHPLRGRRRRLRSGAAAAARRCSRSPWRFVSPWAIAAALVLSALAIRAGARPPPSARPRLRRPAAASCARGACAAAGPSSTRPAPSPSSCAARPASGARALCTLVVHLGQGAGSRRALDVGDGQAAALLACARPAAARAARRVRPAGLATRAAARRAAA